MKSQEKIIEKSISKLNSNLFSVEVITNELSITLKKVFNNSNINIYLFNQETNKIEFTSTNQHLWPIPYYNISWFTSKIHKYSNKQKSLYINNMNQSPLTDFNQLLKDQKKYDYECNDGLFLILNCSQIVGQQHASHER